ncbi:NAD(P)/FAD-dependent oxidoreductase [Ramlibacter sp. WS9]|uniref:NAD(P)/FAD-dependent oxidoreductase n=1 Tax=Ramlibacter sp. WS9 TaxID=1882741 RepID=UPI001305077D|nr:NAD(P)/FAD-dependent oxidoreductase [Ramlibacter sp. WS9]
MADVLIVGAGPAGSATALGLLAAGVEQVLLVDRGSARPFAIGESATPDVAQMLGRLGLETDLGRLGHRPYHGNLSLWGDAKPQADYFLQRGHGHGWHLQRAEFDAWLLQQAVDRGARLMCPTSVKWCTRSEGVWQANLASTDGKQKRVQARMLVDAGGRRAPLATRLGAQRRRLDGLVGLATRATATPALAGMSLVEPFEHGWWYAACLPDGQAVVTLMSDIDVVRSQCLQDWHNYLSAWRTTAKVAELAPPCPPQEQDGQTLQPNIQTFAAHSSYLDRAAGQGWIAVGDALLAFDPLTSSGISGALSDAEAAVPAIVGQLAGDSIASRHYAERANRTFIRYIEGLHRQYGAEQRWPNSVFWSRRHAGPVGV